METQLLEIGEQSTREFYKQREATDTLNDIANAQLLLINDYAASLQASDEIPEKLSKLDADLALAEEQTRQATSVLNDLLIQGNSEQMPETDCSEFIKLIITSQYKNILDIIKDALKNGKPYVTIISLIEFENALATLIESMKDKGMFPIYNEQEDVKRNEKIKQHNQKILGFIEQLRKIQEQIGHH